MRTGEVFASIGCGESCHENPLQQLPPRALSKVTPLTVTAWSLKTTRELLLTMFRRVISRDCGCRLPTTQYPLRSGLDVRQYCM